MPLLRACSMNNCFAVPHGCTLHSMQPNIATCAAVMGLTTQQLWGTFPASGCVLRQSVVDRADRENPPPAVAEAKAVLAAQIEAARSKAPVPAQEATAEE